MHDEYLRLRVAIAEDGRPDPNDFSDACCRRLAGALDRPSSRPSPADLAALVGHVLRRDAALTNNPASWFRVPVASRISWPDAATWQRFGLSVVSGEGHWQVFPRVWEPAWLPGASNEALLQPLHREDSRRNLAVVPGDPFLGLVGQDSYRCEGQRLAIRAILTAPQGATIVVNLPTGAGKSLCAHIPALLDARGTGTTVVVVPTVALALDQERSLAHVIDHPTAYVGGGQSEADQNARKEIRRRLENGTQQILFTAPESLLSTLRLPMHRAARAGLIRRLVIDEAHIVEQWGKEFRTSFQELAGLRSDLLGSLNGGQQRFSTVLLTATLTAAGRDTLATLFGAPGPLVSVNAAQLRPEPSYWIARAPGEDHKVAWVREAIDHLPRPLVLYVRRPRDANEWFRRLQIQGYSRLDTMTGETGASDRASILQRWDCGDTDIIVATSAFGLGVDKADVRAVIHADVPGTIDQFYQEVGRGGRDGQACLSLLIYAPEDMHNSSQSATLIGVDRGLQRWRSMLASAVPLEGGRRRVNVDVRPSNGPEDINMDSAKNSAWNVRTLTLMARAGLLHFGAEEPPVIAIPANAGRDDSVEGQRDFGLLATTRVVQLLRDDTLMPQVWETEVEPLRQSLMHLDQQNHAAMTAVLSGLTCVASVLADVYSLPTEDHPNGTLPQVDVAVACGGCPHCRLSEQPAWAFEADATPRQWPTHSMVGQQLSKVVGSGSLLVTFEEWNPITSMKVIRWLVGQGVWQMVAPQALWRSISQGLVDEARQGRWLMAGILDSFQFETAPRGPVVVLVPNDVAFPPRLRAQLNLERGDFPPRLWFIHSDVRDPYRPERRLHEMVNVPQLALPEFLKKVGL